MKGWEKYEALCIQRGAAEGFRIYEMALLPENAHPNYTHFRCRGGVYAPISRGTRKGHPNWRKPVPGTKAEFIFDIGVLREAQP